MPSPVLPNAFRSAIPSATDSVCVAHTKLFSLPELFRRYVAWKHNTDGTLSEDYLSDVGVTQTPGEEITELDVPTGVFATTTRTTDVTVSWNPVEGAVSYSVYRGEYEDEYAELARDITETTYEDTSGTAGTTYLYTVKAHSATKTSPGYADPATGQKASATTIVFQVPNVATEFLVPDGKTALEVLLWGGGGKGGHFTGASYTGGTLQPGGGGASGAFVRVTGITVTAGEKLVVRIGRKTATNSSANSFVFRGYASSSEYVKAFGGSDGANNDGDNDSAGGAVAVSYGSSTMGGTVQTGDCDLGTAGEDSDGVTDGTGGAAVSYSGYSAGTGGDGVSSTKSTDIKYGRPGLAVLIFS